MTRKKSEKQIDQLAADVTATKPNKVDQTADEQADILKRLSSENEALCKEMQALKRSIGKTMNADTEELKSEIAQRPLQSVLSAFALGFVVSLALRR